MLFCYCVYLNFSSFILFHFFRIMYISVNLCCQKRWVTSIDGHVPFMLLTIVSVGPIICVFWVSPSLTRLTVVLVAASCRIETQAYGFVTGVARQKSYVKLNGRLAFFDSYPRGVNTLLINPFSCIVTERNSYNTYSSQG